MNDTSERIRKKMKTDKTRKNKKGTLRKERTKKRENRNTLKCAIRNNMFESITFARLYRPAQLFVAAYLGHKCVKYKTCTVKFCICL